MALRDDAMALAGKGGVPCHVAAVADRLNDSTNPSREEWLTDANDRSVPSSGLARAMRARQQAISEGPITRHRRGDCACGPEYRR